jgi:hypothetical protein
MLQRVFEGVQEVELREFVREMSEYRNNRRTYNVSYAHTTCESHNRPRQIDTILPATSTG